MSDSATTEVTPESAPWGLLATLALMVLMIGVFYVAQDFFAVIYILGLYFIEQEIGTTGWPTNLNSGFFSALAACLISPFLIGLIVLLIRIRKGPSVGRYLALRPTPMRFLVRWLVVLSVFGFGIDGINYLLGRPIIPRVDVREYETAAFVPLLWIAVILVAPVFEEVLFRGFVFKGIQHSSFGAIGAILITSVFWSLMHLHYDWFGVITIFLTGIILGTARAWTESTLLPIVLHAWMNLIATIEAAIYLRIQ